MSALPHAQPDVDLLALAGQDTRLTRQSRNEWSGACPIDHCGGHDRFSVNISQNRWYCRHCTPKGDSPVGYLMRRDHLPYRDAMAKLEGLTMPAAPAYIPDPQPTDQQRAAFTQIAETCHEALANQEKPLAWLAARGIWGNTITKWKLGYNPKERALPGFPGTTPWQPAKLARGIVIPLVGVDGVLYGISVRTPVGEPKYRCVFSSHVPLYGRPSGTGTVVLVESFLDVLLLDRVAGDLASIVATGSARGSIDAHWLGSLLGYRTWLVAYDADEPGRVGAKGWSHWGRVRSIEVPEGKDASGYWQAIQKEHGQDGADAALRSWLAGHIAAAEPYDQEAADLLVVRLMERYAADEALAPTWPALAARLDAACEAGSMAALRAVVEEAP